MCQNSDIINQFLKENKKYSKVTLYNMNIVLTLFFDVCKKPYNKIQPIDIKNWLNNLYDSGYKSSSICKKFSDVNSFFKYCKEEGLVNCDPTENIKKPAYRYKISYYLDNKQLDKLRELVKNNIRERAIIETLYTTGIRVSELVKINYLDDVDWDKREIKIIGKGEKERFVMFTDECKTLIIEYLKTRNDTLSYLFISKNNKRKIGVRIIERLFKKYSEILGIRITPHTLRHTFAASLSEKGMPIAYIQKLMGHDTMTVTRIYSKLRISARKQIYDKYY